MTTYPDIKIQRRTYGARSRAVSYGVEGHPYIRNVGLSGDHRNDKIYDEIEYVAGQPQGVLLGVPDAKFLIAVGDDGSQQDPKLIANKKFVTDALNAKGIKVDSRANNYYVILDDPADLEKALDTLGFPSEAKQIICTESRGIRGDYEGRFPEDPGYRGSEL